MNQFNSILNIKSQFYRSSILIALLIFCSSWVFMLQAQVSFNPTILVFDETKPIQEIRLTNLSDTDQEVEIFSRFGYSSSDSLGNLLMVYGDSTKSELYDLSDNLLVFPKKFIMAARSRQLVRLQVLKIGEMENQVYWSRLGIRSQKVTADIELSESVTRGTSISYVIQQNLGVFFKKGPVSTGIELGEVKFEAQRDTLNIKMSLNRNGNSPYLGLVNAKVLNSEGKEIGFAEQVISIYFDSVIKLTVFTDEILSGAYTLETFFETTRADIPEEQIINSDPKVFTEKFLIRD